MEEGTKKAVMVIIVVVCLTAAGVITYMTRSGGGSVLRPGTMIWVKCNNPDCAAEYEIDQKDYLDFIRENAIPGFATVPPMKCEQCGEDSVFRAVKCEECGKVFFPGTVEGSYQDKCPDCGYSKLESRRRGE